MQTATKSKFLCHRNLNTAGSEFKQLYSSFLFSHQCLFFQSHFFNSYLILRNFFMSFVLCAAVLWWQHSDFVQLWNEELEYIKLIKKYCFGNTKISFLWCHERAWKCQNLSKIIYPEYRIHINKDKILRHTRNIKEVANYEELLKHSRKCTVIWKLCSDKSIKHNVRHIPTQARHSFSTMQSECWQFLS